MVEAQTVWYMEALGMKYHYISKLIEILNIHEAYCIYIELNFS